MEVRNLTEENVKIAESMFDKMKESNPDLRYKTYRQIGRFRNLQNRF